MYAYNVSIDCVTDDGEAFWAIFQVWAEDEFEAVSKAKLKARKEGYSTRWKWEARDPRIKRI